MGGRIDDLRVGALPIIVTLGLLAGCAAAPAEPIQTRDAILVVSNASATPHELAFASGGQGSSTEGASLIEACSSLLVSFGQAHERLEISVDDQQVMHARLPAGAEGILVVDVVIDEDGDIHAGVPRLQEVAPSERPQPPGCQ